MLAEMSQWPVIWCSSKPTININVHRILATPYSLSFSSLKHPLFAPDLQASSRKLGDGLCFVLFFREALVKFHNTIHDYVQVLIPPFSMCSTLCS